MTPTAPIGDGHPDGATAHELRRRRYFFFPKGTPDAIIARVNAAAAETLDTPVVRKRIEDLGLIVPKPAERGSDFLARLVVSELDKWGPPIKAAGISAD